MVSEIKSDGHCLYRAVEDQLDFSGGYPYNYQELRAMVASYMREHASDFLPFFLSDTKIEVDSNGSLSERFEKYCEEVESTHMGGTTRTWCFDTLSEETYLDTFRSLSRCGDGKVILV
ncbi:hypothetical protein NE237_009301 [Protea cynaroides]|uniref:OTU domain-containing protein n=1 Tax=Protea cynaroides TaxID=273540 RepID=A0A9Q0KXJ8_9MAGN|nr:hypothetical protein NE237_009301 [Protea cynaroides]